MQIIVNGKIIVVDDGLSIAELISQKEINSKAVIVEYNYQLVKKEEWPKIILKKNDRLEIFQFVGGG